MYRHIRHSNKDHDLDSQYHEILDSNIDFFVVAYLYTKLRVKAKHFLGKILVLNYF